MLTNAIVRVRSTKSAAYAWLHVCGGDGDFLPCSTLLQMGGGGLKLPIQAHACMPHSRSARLLLQERTIAN